MKIGISTSVIQRGKTGIAQYLFALLRAFKARGKEHEFTLFVLEEDLPLFDFALGNMTVVPVPEKYRPAVKNIHWHQFELPKFARELQLDVLHIPSYRRLLWQQPCATVATIHDLAPFHVADKYDWKRMLYGRVIVKRLAHRQHEIIAISENTARDIVHYFGVQRDRITVIHNGVDHERFQPGSRETARKLVADTHGLKAPFFLYVARLEHPGKNHIRLIQAFNEFKATTGSKWQLVFGGSDWHGAEEIHKAIKASPVSSDIRSLGFVADAALPTLYRAADCFIYPSLYEGFGLPPVEAMACGTPVISSARGSLGEVVGNAAVIVDPEDIGQMKQKMTELSTNPAMRDKLSRGGLAHAKLFNWHDAAEKTLHIYARAVEQRVGFLAASNIIPIPITKS